MATPEEREAAAEQALKELEERIAKQSARDRVTIARQEQDRQRRLDNQKNNPRRK